MGVEVDYVQKTGNGWTGGGALAARLVENGMKTNILRPAVNHKDPRLRVNGLLTTDDWKAIDATVLATARAEFNGVADLMERGLTYDPGTGIGEPILQSHKRSKLEDAEATMDGLTETRNDRLDYGVDYLPMPVVSRDVHFSLREINAMRNSGRNLETDHIEAATESVSSKIESMLFNGDSALVHGGGQVYGYTTESNVNTVSLTASWTADSGTDIIGDVNSLRKALISDNHTGPFVLYYCSKYAGVIGEDYKSGVSGSVYNRILEVPGIEDVKLSTKLDDDEVVLVEMRSRTARLVNPVDIQTIQWDVEGGLGVRMKVMAIMTPQVRSDQSGQSGIAVGST